MSVGQPRSMTDHLTSLMEVHPQMTPLLESHRPWGCPKPMISAFFLFFLPFGSLPPLQLIMSKIQIGLGLWCYPSLGLIPNWVYTKGLHLRSPQSYRSLCNSRGRDITRMYVS